MQKISLFTFTEIVPSPSRSKRPNAARISCSFAPENLFFFWYFFYSFTTLPWTCAHLLLKSSQESQILSQFPLCSSRWLSMLTHSIWPSPHLPCKQQTTDYLRWLRLWFCGRCRNNVAPKWHAIFIQRDHGCPVVIMKVSRQFQWEHMNFCNKISSVKFHFKDSLVLSHILSIFQ